MSYSSHKGFTLIELLVVIAVIGILSSIVIASVSSARIKGADATVKSAFAQIRTQAENYYNDNSTFGASINAACATNCTTLTGTNTTTGILSNSIVNSQIMQASKSSNGSITITTDSSGTKWAISTSLKYAANTLCLDNSGVNATGKTASTTGTCL